MPTIIGIVLASKETDSLQVWTRTNTRQDDNILFLTLETIDGVEVDRAEDLFTESLSKSALQLRDLSPIHGDDANFEVEIRGRELLDEPIV